MSEIYRVPAGDSPQRNAEISAEMLEELIERGAILPGERLSDAFPKEFENYCREFIDFFPSTPYHAKTTYDPSSRFGGWPEKKSRKTGTPLRLIDSGTWLNRSDCVERHLDHEHWWDFRQFTGTDRGVRPEFFWLGLNAPKKATFNAIDADNKRVIGWYGERTADKPLMPVMQMPLEHFAVLKKLYDSFPNRIWCITSETLGLDIVERHGLASTLTTHDRVKRELARIGLGNTEVHPMAGRCKRRPFGEHYRTITAKGVLTTWQQQLDYFLSPGQTPSFRQIAQALLDGLIEQWRCWRDRRDARNCRLDVGAEIARQEEEVERIRRWLDDDCPTLARTVVALPAKLPASIESPAEAEGRYKIATAGTNLDLSSLRGGRWAQKLEILARNGLPADDTVGLVVFEIAKWLWWIELFELPERERFEKCLALLSNFVTEKHNGCITRWNLGLKDEVISQVERCLTSAIAFNIADKKKSLAIYSQLRNKRAIGQYKQLILLEPLLSSDTGLLSPSPSSLSSPLSIYFSVSGLGAPLPEEVLDWINKKRGRNQVEQYATRLSNFLFETSQWTYIPRKEAQEVFLGYTNPNRHHKYNQILLRAGVIDLDIYRAHIRPTGYRLTVEARAIMEQHRSQ
jgi:hypothetical protein